MGGGFCSKNTLKGAYLPGNDTNPSFDDYAEAITTVLINANFKQDKLPLLILETGRFELEFTAAGQKSSIYKIKSPAGKKAGGQ